MPRRSEVTRASETSRAANSMNNSAGKVKRGEVPSGRPIASAVADFRTKKVEQRLAQLEQDLCTLRAANARLNVARESTRRGRAVSPQKVFISTMKARGMVGRQICRALDAAERKEFEPLPSWIKTTGLRLWVDLWNCGDRVIRNRVRTYVHSVTPFDPKARH